MYLKNDETGTIGIFANPQTGWTELTEEELDDFLLKDARIDKFKTLDGAKDAFCETGFEYDECFFCTTDSPMGDIVLQDKLLSYESSGVSVTAETDLYTLPGGHGLTFTVNQLIEVLGFTESANNGVKKVQTFSGNDLTVQESLADEEAGDDISIITPDRYRRYDTCDIQQSFTDCAGWEAFFDAITQEKNRIMNYYYAKRKEISDAEDMETLDAITIDFSA